MAARSSDDVAYDRAVEAYARTSYAKSCMEHYILPHSSRSAYPSKEGKVPSNRMAVTRVGSIRGSRSISSGRNPSRSSSADTSTLSSDYLHSKSL